jgi:CRP-like cAMP-binding protein
MDENRNKVFFVRNLDSGDYFGELALIRNEARSLSCISVTNCKLLKLSREVVNRIISSINLYLSKDYEF